MVILFHCPKQLIQTIFTKHYSICRYLYFILIVIYILYYAKALKRPEHTCIAVWSGYLWYIWYFSSDQHNYILLCIITYILSQILQIFSLGFCGFLCHIIWEYKAYVIHFFIYRYIKYTMCRISPQKSNTAFVHLAL